MAENTPRTPEWSKSLSRELEDVINRYNISYFYIFFPFKALDFTKGPS